MENKKTEQKSLKEKKRTYFITGLATIDYPS
jgi:hypothetical protein